MDARKILRGLDQTTHDERMRRMVALGETARATPAVARAIAALAEGGFFERMLALQSVHGSRDGRLAAQAARDPSRQIRGRALQLVALYCDDEQVAGVLRDARRAYRLPLVRRLRERGRTGPIDAFLDDLAAAGDRDLTALLPLGSGAAVARRAAGAFERATPAHWARLARFHPQAALALLGRLLDGASAGGAWMRRAANAVLDVLARRDPDAAVGLAQGLALRWPVGTLALARLARTRPDAVAALLAGATDVTPVWGPRPRPRRLGPEGLLGLLARRPELLPQPERWLRRLPPDLRVRAREAAGSAWQDANGAVAPGVLAHLPAERRRAEARRHLALPALGAHPSLWLPYAALLSWDEARSVTEPFLGHPDPTLRAAAGAALLATLRFERERLGDGLALMHAHRNEADPVRCAMLSALASLPTPAFQTAHLQRVGGVLREALDAADHSGATTAAAQQLVVRLLPRHPAWAASWLETLVRERGTIALGDLEARWNDTQVRPLQEALAPLLQAWSRRERDEQIVALARALGARLRAFDALHPHLERIARESRGGAAPEALGLLGRHARDRFVALIPSLLNDDRSWGTQPPVYVHLHLRRQDLLDRYLGRKAWPGRFQTGKTRFVLPLCTGFFRWTPRQQHTFATTLGEVVASGDRDHDIPTVRAAVQQLAALPALGPDPIVRLADDPSRPAVRDAALRALARLDTDAGLPPLVRALGDERARVAAYALRRPVLDMPPAEAIGLLRAAPLKGLTVAKEVVRLAGEVRGPEAFGLLRTLQQEAGQGADGGQSPVHRDLRIALLRAYRGHLDRAEAWEELEQAATEPDPALVWGLVRIPFVGLSTAERERYATVLQRLLDHPDPAVRCAVLARLAADPLADREGRLLAAAVGRLRSVLPTERAAAAEAVVGTAAAPDADRLAATLASLADDRRAQKALLEALIAWTPRERLRLLPVARAVVEALAADAAPTAHCAALIVAAFEPPEMAAGLEALAQRGALSVDVQRAVLDAFGVLARGPMAPVLDALVDRYESHPDERLRRLGLAALVARSEAGRGPGWTPDRIARLQTFRQDPSPLVASAARFTLPQAEVEPLPGRVAP